jgi:alpha-methylacyl-CoA racemase
MGPLEGLRIVELAGIGPGPLAAMLLGDMGADIIRIDRVDAGESLFPMDVKYDVASRSRRSLALDIRKPEGLELLLKLIDSADGLIEGFRPGVTERLGFGPDVCLKRNPRLVYGRMTGFGQDGPLAKAAGHDINYISLTGALNAIGRAGQSPVPPLNLAGDYGGGTMFLAFGMVCAFVERARSGKGQVVDAAMVDGASILSAIFYGMSAAGLWSEKRGENLLDSGAPFYDVYETKDGLYVSFGGLEPKFFATFVQIAGIDAKFVQRQNDKSAWPEMRGVLTALFRTRTRAEWVALLEGTDACFAGVLTFKEAPHHPHNKARNAFIELAGVPQPAPAPRFSRTKPATPTPPVTLGQHTDAVLSSIGISSAEIAALRQKGIVGGAV